MIVWSRQCPLAIGDGEIIERPALSTSQLVGTGTTVKFSPDKVGVYKIRFTACASDCKIELPDQPKITVHPDSREVAVRVLAILPPEGEPVRPPPPNIRGPTSVSIHCASPIWLDNVWRTVKPWSGPDDYELLEGRVSDSRVSTGDSWLNHDSWDWCTYVIPDRQNRWLLGSKGGQGEIEVEWERDCLPEMFRPTIGDRVSAIGYWVYDCDHEDKTEIHPPVLLAVHRPRALALPTSAGCGSNAYVPGIVTDIWVNQDGGETTDCSTTGLAQQIHPSKPPTGPPFYGCLPDSEGFSHNPINRLFEFNIYLPRSPQALMAALGKTAPPVPLYTEISNPTGSEGPEPLVEQITEGIFTYLRVRIDLSAYTRPTYSRRIVAGWAYAAPDNWGLRRWNLRITSLDVLDDADSDGRGDGDWRFWVNTNNGMSEWTKLFDCSACVHGNENFEGRPWETATTAPGAAKPEHWLGPSLLLFPNQNIRVATRGFEDDWFRSDSIASIDMSLGQMPISQGRWIANEGDGRYWLNFQVQPGDEVGRAQLSPDAQARYDAYSLTNSDLKSVPAATLERLQTGRCGNQQNDTAHGQDHQKTAT